MMDECETEICYGALFDAFAKPCGNHNLMRHTTTQATDVFSTFSLIEQQKGVFSMTVEQKQIAVLDVRMTSKLVALRQIPGVKCEAVVPNRTILKRKAKSSSPFQISINIFGPRKAADEVSAALSKVNAFLQHPQTLNVDVEYYNPDMLIFPGQNTTMNHLIGTSQLLLEESKLSRDVRGILDSLSQVAEGDELGHLGGLISALTQHQQQGVRFVLQREDELICRRLRAHVSQTTGAESPMQADDTPFALGGLVADVMGIGKTLTMLTSILHSTNHAKDFSYFGRPIPGYEAETLLTKATLVVVPSVQLLENWESEISTHFSMDALRRIRFHGPNRPQTVEALTEPDIVLTTYATMAADQDNWGLLYRMEWYRVVLDEAHHIRNPTSKQWKAAANLRTTRRWCLSGTPIQNKMEDLASLAGFLQLPPLISKDSFEKHVLRPLSEPTTNSKPLRAYMEAYCLRRSESCLSLPASREEVVPLYLSPPERQAYDGVLDDARRQIDDMVSSGKHAGVRCSKLFTALLRMRMMCNTGTYASIQGSQDMLTSLSPLKLESLLSQCERCSAADGDTLMLLSTCEVCPDCMRPLRQRSPSPISSLASRLEDVAASAKGRECSTKLEAVVGMLVSRSNSRDKAIVFSYWKTTLHLLARLLRATGIPYLQVDGDTSFVDRSSRLRAFKEESDVHVLLMTVETGAVGLNLTVANQVHIVEPQWNPSVEEQAVARAVRMGQKREVTIYRYVLQNTVEQNIVKLQEKKRNLAKYTLGTKSDQSISDAVQELESVLELNPRKRGLDE
ncbi:hypothetical protein FJTKL_06561 [Diaporthe vaccinii]|uniref:Uncharacterized protein n=2 Tax=Diaporthe vaccinii TaxID=105482 RepID=A0ABR4DPY9_9PEZI